MKSEPASNARSHDLPGTGNECRRRASTQSAARGENVGPGVHGHALAIAASVSVTAKKA